MPAQWQPPARARRFYLRLPLRYRALGERCWHRGVTENVSCSGVLLRGRRVPPTSAVLELLLPVPRQLCGEARLLVLCRGRIARVVPRRLPLFPSTVGIRVVDYELIGDLGAESRGGSTATRLPEMIHDLNNMLAVVIGGSELILSDPDAVAATRRHAESIRGAGQRAADIIQQLTTRGTMARGQQ